jgi:hypothetical protein
MLEMGGTTRERSLALRPVVPPVRHEITLEAKMKQWVIAGMLTGSLALAGAAAAQQKQPPPPPPPKPAATGQQPTGEQPPPAKKPATKRRAPSGEAANASGTHTAPKQQPSTTGPANVSDTAMALGTVRIPKAVKADGKPLAAGTYQVRLTTEEAKPDAVGTSGKLERWVEFLKAGKVVGREVATIVPQNEIAMVQKDTPPHPGGSKVEMLKGGDYLRVWINRGGNHYLVHLPV